MSWLDAVDDPYERLKILRELEPVFWSDEISAWVFTRYDDAADGLRDPPWRRSVESTFQLLASTAGEEILRFEPPMSSTSAVSRTGTSRLAWARTSASAPRWRDSRDASR